MKKGVFYILIAIAILLPSCHKHATGTSVVVKPRTYHRWYDRKKDKHTMRTRKVRVKN